MRCCAGRGSKGQPRDGQRRRQDRKERAERATEDRTERLSVSRLGLRWSSRRQQPCRAERLGLRERPCRSAIYKEPSAIGRFGQNNH
ncbi:hypothetical protein BN903_25 [Halorubrum sp. AJ67]|nr:hypothetical protein BN903_25 [Halorubrum sp. AJ67]